MQAVAQRLPAASDPVRAASSPALAASAPARPVSAATVPLTPAYNAITVQLQPQDKPDKAWYVDPSFWAAIIPALALIVTIFNTNKQLKAGRDTLERQLADERDRQERELADARATTELQLAAQRERERLDRVTKARQSIYGEILVDYQKVQALIGGMANGDPTQEINLSALSTMSTGINKLWIWGEVESAYEVREFFSQVNEFAWEAWSKAESIRRLKNLYKGFKDGADELTILWNQAEKELDNHRKADAETQAFEPWKMIDDHLVKESNAHYEHRQSLGLQAVEISNGIAKQRNLYSRFIVDGQARLMIQVNKVMSLARLDVELRGDVGRLEQQSLDMSDRAREAVAKAHRSLEKHMYDGVTNDA